MSTNLSSNSLFHFTKKYEYLTSILEIGFLPRYVIEDYTSLESVIPKLAIPMVCFCDIPLTHTLEHTDHYGKYGIGLSKDWANSKDINPVAYLTTRAKIKDFYDDLFMQSNKDNGFSNLVFEIIKYLKPYQGESGNGIMKVFYNEKEWRYIFRGKNIEEFRDLLHEHEFEQIRDYNFMVEPYPLNVSPSDIRYLIVDKRDEVFKLSEFIFNSKRFSKKDRYKLMSCIISIEDIKEDF